MRAAWIEAPPGSKSQAAIDGDRLPRDHRRAKAEEQDDFGKVVGLTTPLS